MFILLNNKIKFLHEYCTFLDYMVCSVYDRLMQRQLKKMTKREESQRKPIKYQSEVTVVEHPLKYRGQL